MNTFKKFTYAKGGKPILVNMKHVSSISSDNDGPPFSSLLVMRKAWLCLLVLTLWRRS